MAGWSPIVPEAATPSCSTHHRRVLLDLAADGVPVTGTCRVPGFSTQAFYKWRKALLPQRDWDDAHLINAARDIHADDPAFGYRFIADELPGRGIIAGENRVARLCSQERIWSIFAKKRGLNRRCMTTSCNVSSAPKLPTRSGWLTSPSTAPLEFQESSQRSAL